MFRVNLAKLELRFPEFHSLQTSWVSADPFATSRAWEDGSDTTLWSLSLSAGVGGDSGAVAGLGIGPDPWLTGGPGAAGGHRAPAAPPTAGRQQATSNCRRLP